MEDDDGGATRTRLNPKKPPFLSHENPKKYMATSKFIDLFAMIGT